MSSGEMRIGEILEHSIRIEHESMLFYQQAVTRTDDPSVQELLQELAAEEVKHEARLSELREKIGPGEPRPFQRETLEQLIRNRQIPEGAGRQEVLQVALQREELTRDFYLQVSTMTNLAPDIVDLFDMLYKQESGHVSRIESKLKKLD